MAGDQKGAQAEKEGGQDLGKATPAELAGDQAGKKDGEREGQRRKEAEAEQGVAEERPRQARHGDRTYGLIDIAPGEVARGLEEVELVAVVAVA